MPPTPLPVQTLVRGGVTPTAEVAADAANGNILATNNGVSTWVEATNTDTESHTLTLVTPGTVDGLAIADKVVTIPAGAKWRSGPLPVMTYGSKPQITADSALVTIAARQI